MVGKVLRQHGASVLLASRRSKQALDLYRQHRNEIDLILLDLTMPGLSGEEILLQLQQLKATQKIVIMSGYGEAETMQRCAELGVVGFISKPFELQVIVAKLPIAARLISAHAPRPTQRNFALGLRPILWSNSNT